MTIDRGAAFGGGAPDGHGAAGARRQGIQCGQRAVDVTLVDLPFGAGEDGVGVVADRRADAPDDDDAGERVPQPVKEGAALSGAN